MLGIGAAGAVALPTAFDALRIDRRWIKVTQTRLRMGTYVTMTAVHDSRDQAEEAIGKAFDEMDRLVAIFSRHDSATPVSVLNRDGVLNGPPPELVDVLLRSREVSLRTNGAFDATVKPLLDLMVETVDKGGRVPDAAAIDAAMSRVGYDGVNVTGNRVRFTRPDMGITLDGVAKGHIVDCASRVLGDHGVENHLINAGGDIRVRGTRSDGNPWRIAVQDPKKKANYPAVIELRDGAVATSGSYEVYFDKQRMYHHIVDPRNGLSPRGGASVSVVAGSVMEADALSTTVFVLEPTEGVRFIDSTRGAECLAVAKGGALFQSKGWSAHARASG